MDKFRVTFDGYWTTENRKQLGVEALTGHENIEIKYPKPGFKEMIEPEDIADCDALILIGARVTEDSLKGVERLKLVARFGAGFNTVDLEACTRHGVMVTNAPLGPTESMAETTIGLIISLSFKFPEKSLLVKEGRWNEKLNYIGAELQGRTLGILGLGNIGSRVAELAGPFKMRIIACDPYVPEEKFERFGVERVDLDRLVTESDFLTIHCPLTRETHNMFGEAEFDRMKGTACIINTSRGGFYSDRVLAEALSEGKIAGAAVDVFEDEPFVENNPLVESPNTILTPHNIGLSGDMANKIWSFVANSVAQCSRGELPDNILNPEVLSEEERARAKVSSSFVPK